MGFSVLFDATVSANPAVVVEAVELVGSGESRVCTCRPRVDDGCHAV